MEISEILKEKNLEPEKLMPVHRPVNEIVLLNVPDRDPAPFPPFLPLHYFDNDDYEIWTPDEWLNKGIEHSVYKPIPGRALLPNVPSNKFGNRWTNIITNTIIIDLVPPAHVSRRPERHAPEVYVAKRRRDRLRRVQAAVARATIVGQREDPG